jgi:hypothetical protein
LVLNVHSRWVDRSTEQFNGQNPPMKIKEICLRENEYFALYLHIPTIWDLSILMSRGRRSEFNTLYYGIEANSVSAWCVLSILHIASDTSKITSRHGSAMHSIGQRVTCRSSEIGFIHRRSWWQSWLSYLIHISFYQYENWAGISWWVAVKFSQLAAPIVAV